MKKKSLIIVLSISGVLVILCLISITTRILNYSNSAISIKKTRAVEENQLLQEISAKIGVEPSWLSFRHYVYCKSLKKGMTRTEVENVLSGIGEIIIFDAAIDFRNRTISTKLGPVILVFDNSGPDGKLISLKRSPDQNLGQPLADCEKDQ